MCFSPVRLPPTRPRLTKRAPDVERFRHPPSFGQRSTRPCRVINRGSGLRLRESAEELDIIALALEPRDLPGRGGVRHVSAPWLEGVRRDPRHSRALERGGAFVLGLGKRGRHAAAMACAPGIWCKGAAGEVAGHLLLRAENGERHGAHSLWRKQTACSGSKQACGGSGCWAVTSREMLPPERHLGPLREHRGG